MPIQRSILCPVLVGRGSELESLTRLLHEVQAGAGQSAVISGEAGIGKSRLTAEAKKIAGQIGFSIFEGRCFESDRAVPYAPLVDLLRSFYTACPPDEISQYFPFDASALIKLLPEPAGIVPGSARVDFHPDPEQEKQHLFESLVQFFFNAAARAPLLIVIEDLHWSDESNLDFLLYLVRRMTSQPIALVLTLRAGEGQPGLDHFLVTLHRYRSTLEIGLTPLEMDQVEVMIREIFKLSQPVREDFVTAMYRLTEGNPFFVEEILKSLVSANRLDPDGKWDRKPIEELHLPLSLQDIVQQRMKQVDPKARQVLTIAAVIGQRFDFALLQEISGTEEAELTDLLKQLIAAQLITEDSADQFSFRHALIREAVYATLLQRERQKLHCTIAETLERMAAGNPGRRVADLAYHFYQGASWDKALKYSQEAGTYAQSLYAPAEAVENFSRALESARELQITPPILLYRERGQAYELLGRLESARRDYERALEAARQRQDGAAEWQSLIDLGFLWAGRDYHLTGKYFQEALALADQIADPILRARSLNRLGNWLLNTGRFDEGLQAHRDALAIFEEQHDQAGMAETLDLLGPTYGMQGDRVKAVQQLKEAIALFRNLGDKQRLISSLAMLAIQSMPGASETTFSALRPPAECVQDASEALRLAREVGSRAGEAFAENALAHVLLSFGEFGPALSHAQGAQRIAAEIEHEQWVVATDYCLGHIYLLLLAPEQAITILETGLLLAQKLGSAYWTATLAAKLGLAYILKDDLSAAQTALQAVMAPDQLPAHVAERDVALAWGEFFLASAEPGSALQIAEQLLASAPGKPPDRPAQPIPHLLKLKGQALMALGHPEEALRALEAAKHGARQRTARPVLWTIHRALGQVYETLRNSDQVRQESAAARNIIEGLAATIEAAALRAEFQRAALDSLPREKPLARREAARQAFGGLTARECEVAILVAEGRTSREIADRLVVSERTAEVHVGHILRKLGFTSRAQIAVWVFERGLLKH